MKHKLIGFWPKSGDFTKKETGEVIQYDNITFYCTYKPSIEGFHGEKPIEIKIKRSYIDVDENTLDTYINKNVKFDIEPYGQSVRYTGIYLDPDQT